MGYISLKILNFQKRNLSSPKKFLSSEISDDLFLVIHRFCGQFSIHNGKGDAKLSLPSTFSNLFLFKITFFNRFYSHLL